MENVTPVKVPGNKPQRHLRRTQPTGNEKVEAKPIVVVTEAIPPVNETQAVASEPDPVATKATRKVPPKLWWE